MKIGSARLQYQFYKEKVDISSIKAIIPVSL